MVVYICLYRAGKNPIIGPVQTHQPEVSNHSARQAVDLPAAECNSPEHGVLAEVGPRLRKILSPEIVQADPVRLARAR